MEILFDYDNVYEVEYIFDVSEKVATNGKSYNYKYYNLDMIIAIGYRVNSKRATEFRKWATN